VTAVLGRFLVSRSGKAFGYFVLFSALAAFAAGYGYYQLSLASFQRTKTEEKLTAIGLVDAFVSNYAGARSEFLKGDAPVPATFRAHAIERFNQNRGATAALRLVMVGPPGREIKIPPSDADMAATISRFLEQSEPRAETRFVTLGGEPVFRTIYPSIASEQSCVDCHNRLQPDKVQWKLNDVIGALAVDVPAKSFLRRNLYEASGLSAAIFLLMSAIGAMLCLLQHRHLAERAAAQCQLQASEERFRDFAEASSDWFWEQDENLRFTFVSDRVDRKAGLAASAHVGKLRKEIVGPGVTEEQWSVHQADLDAHRPFTNFRFQRVGDDGQPRHIAISGKPVFAGDGSFRGYRGIGRDVTSEVEYELDLSRRVAERTAELEKAQADLVRKERLSVLGQMTATVAHELRNPLSAIRNSVFTVREMVKSAGLKLDRPVERIERNIGRCDRIISDLLNYTRMPELRRANLVAEKWLGEVLDEQKTPDSIALLRDFRAPDATAMLDPERLRQVIVILIDNAAQAMAEQEPDGLRERRIVVGCSVADGLLSIVVEDAGAGIPPEILPRVFEPLFSTKSFGTGLGLPTAKQIVEMHGGRIELESEPGRGTRAIVLLPLAEEDRAAA
jgi:PAS domain S-box-containing protein